MHKKIQIVFTCVLFFFFVNAFSQEHTWSSADVIASVNEEGVTSVNAVNDGYVISGYLSGRVKDIASDELYGGTNGFVAKYSNNSELQWIFTIGTSSDDTVKTTTGPDGSIYVYGTFKGVVHFGGTGQSDVTVGSANDTSTYIIKYNADGKYLESHFKSGGNLKIVDVEISEDEKVLVVGDFKREVKIGSKSYSTNNYPGKPYNTVYFALEENNLESVIWSNAFNGASEVRTIGLTLTSDKLIIVVSSMGSVFGIDGNKTFNGPPGGKYYVLSSIDLSNGKNFDWFYTLILPKDSVDISGVSYSSGMAFLQINTRDYLFLRNDSVIYENSLSPISKSYSFAFNPNQNPLEFSIIKEFRSSDSLNVVDIKAHNGNVYLLAGYKKDLRSTDFVLNAQVETEEMAVIKLDNNLDFWYAHKAKERGDFIKPVALDVHAEDEYYVAGNFSKRVYLDKLSVEYLPSNSSKIFSARSEGIAPFPVNKGDLVDDNYCFVKNATVEVELPVFENDLTTSSNNKVITGGQIKGSAKVVNNEVVYEFANESNYETSFEYFIPSDDASERAIVNIRVIDSTILAKDSSVCGRENFSVNLYDLYGYSVDTIEFRDSKGEIVNRVNLEVSPPTQVDIIKVNSLCEEKRTVTLNKREPSKTSIDTSLVSCSEVLDVSELYSEYSAPFNESADVLAFNTPTSELVMSGKGNHTVYFDKLLPIECYIEELETNIEVVLPEKGTSGSNYEVYPLDEIELYGEESLTGENRWEVISGDATILSAEGGESTVQMGERESLIEYRSIDEHNCVFAVDTFGLSIQAFFVPNAFSPNNDGLNDTFFIRGCDQIPNKKLVVFNTQGLKVFEANNYQNDWEGVSLQGEPLPDDVYYFEYTILGEDYTGYIEIKR